MSHKKAKAIRRGTVQGAADVAWTPFQRSYLPPMSESQVRDQAEKLGVSFDELMATYKSIEDEEIIYLNSRYQVNVRICMPENGGPSELTHLSIKRIDKRPIHDWRDLQRIKNEIIGPEFEAVELYPAESRLIDTANQYHLWVVTSPGYKFPFGFNGRLVIEEPGGNAVQRPFEKS